MGTRLVQYTTEDGRARSAILADETATDPAAFRAWRAWNGFPESIVAYVGKTLGDGMGVERHGSTSSRALTDWHGNQIGTCYLSTSWPVRSYIGTRMFQIYATVNGVEYTGRGFGESMSVVLRPRAKQSRR